MFTRLKTTTLKNQHQILLKWQHITIKMFSIILLLSTQPTSTTFHSVTMTCDGPTAGLAPATACSKPSEPSSPGKTGVLLFVCMQIKWKNKNLSIYWEPQMYSEVWDISSLHLFFFQLLLHSSLILCLTSSYLDSFHVVTLYGGAIKNTLDNQGPRSLLGCRGDFGHKIWRKWVWWCNHLQIRKGSVLGHKTTLQRWRPHHELKSHASWCVCLMRDLLICVSSSENTVRTWNTEFSSQWEVKLGIRTPTQCLEWYGGNPSFRIKVSRGLLQKKGSLWMSRAEDPVHRSEPTQEVWSATARGPHVHLWLIQ